ncbi:uncharacterized protein LOC115769454 isoform X1 [Drosophila novamexicana]|uniref:uncharacterized protein LOC115769454 isoform X1 n=1 Tax=Drosophila novamexicana TaxID=47314 RepID=UPI0011E588ED|nr:uncharacterized protein LOC115769454 isoform X1 [Drosophila novamexicana]
MSTLRICKAMSLHPRANIATSDAEQAANASSRICLMGCEASPAELRRFPVHDTSRCNYWLRHFGVSDQLVEELGGLKKLRICFRHFSQRKAMAKTRIKTTPLRISKPNKIATEATTTTTTTEAITAAITAATTGTASAKPMADSTTIELVDSSSGNGHALKQGTQEQSVTTITPVPQRSHSICSSSSVSSDVQSISSDYEASMPLSALVDAHAQHGTGKATNGLAKKRKLYLITEKADEKNGSNLANGQKRKMFVVVEQEKDTAAKKLMIVTDKPQANLTQHLEKFLPEILSCIQGKEQQAQAKVKHPLIKHQAVKQEPLPVKPALPIIQKPHITLPPKKNPTNFVKLEGSPGITLPASVSIVPVEPVKESPPPLETETNINLSPDFRFLMKILPKLEQLPEPHKQHVKRSIQIFVEESYSHYGKKE